MPSVLLHSLSGISSSTCSSLDFVIRAWLLKSPCMCLNPNLDCHLFFRTKQDQEANGALRLKALRPISISSTEECRPVFSCEGQREAGSLFFCLECSWSEELRPCLKWLPSCGTTLSGELSVMHHLQPCPGEGKAAAKLLLQEHVRDSSALHMRVRCGWLGVW